VVDDPTLSAPDKLLTYFRRIGSYKAAQAGFMVDLSRALELDANAQVKARLHEVSIEGNARHLTRILAQGVDEGAFDHARIAGRHLARYMIDDLRIQMIERSVGRANEVQRETAQWMSTALRGIGD